MSSKMQDKKIEIIVSDPWEFGTIHGTGPFLAEVLKEKDNEALLIKLDKALEFEQVQCQYFVASPRLEGDSISDIPRGKTVGCNLTRITKEHANSADPFDLSWWRGGVGLIASLSIAKEAE